MQLSSVSDRAARLAAEARGQQLPGWQAHLLLSLPAPAVGPAPTTAAVTAVVTSALRPADDEAG